MFYSVGPVRAAEQQQRHVHYAVTKYCKEMTLFKPGWLIYVLNCLGAEKMETVWVKVQIAEGKLLHGKNNRGSISYLGVSISHFNAPKGCQDFRQRDEYLSVEY